MTGLPELLADCDAHGIRVLPAGDGGLTIDAPQDALTPDLMKRLKAHKAELLARLAGSLEPPACRCGSGRYIDTPIHNGQSTRRDCARCRRFLEFPKWHELTNGRIGRRTVAPKAGP